MAAKDVRCVVCGKYVPDWLACDGFTTCMACPEPGHEQEYVVRCSQCGSEYSYERGCCTGCGRS
jgi:hypothetical protein